MKKNITRFSFRSFGMSVGLPSMQLTRHLPLLLLLLRPRHWDKFTVLCGRKVKTAMSPSISACSATVTMTNWLNRQPIWFPIPIILTWVR